MESSIRIARISGIDIGVHFSWILIFLLVTWSVAVGYLPEQLPGLAPLIYWLFGAIAAILLFASVLIHELSHSLVAQAWGMRVHDITLFLFGGVSHMHGETDSPGKEFQIAFVGPLTSFGLAALCFGLAVAVGTVSPPLFALLVYLASINLGLAIFNLIPGFPLDGGRVFQAILWAATHDRIRSTKIAAGVGTAIAYLMILGGLLLAVSGNIVSGLWIAFMGWFLSNAAAQSRTQLQQDEQFGDVRVRDVMRPNPIVVSPATPLPEAIYSHLLTRQVSALPVVANGRLTGMLSLEDLQAICQADWPRLTVGDVVCGRDGVGTVSPDLSLAEAAERLHEDNVRQLPVVEGERVVGLISRSDVGRFLQLHSASHGGPVRRTPRAA